MRNRTQIPKIHPLMKSFSCWDSDFPTVESFYQKQIRAFSPNMDGTNTQLELVDPLNTVMKAELTTADTGAWAHIYSLGIFRNYATSEQTFGVLPKKPWKVDGYRAVTAASITSGVGIAEAQSLGTAVEPTYVEVSPSPKEWEVVSDFSKRLQIYNTIADAISVDENREQIAADFFTSLNQDLVQDNDTLASNNIESIDRVCGSYAEITACGQTAGDLDIYSLDRDAAATWTDANVLQNGTTDRDFSVSLLNQLRQNQEPYWGKTGLKEKVYVTGFDTWTRLSEIEAAKQRFGTETVNITVDGGISTMPGQAGGLKVATWDTMPMIRDNLIKKDTISRMYLLDTSNLGIAIGIPIEWNQVDGKGEGAAIVGHRTRGWWYGAGELYCTNFPSQGKLRELQ